MWPCSVTIGKYQPFLYVACWRPKTDGSSLLSELQKIPEDSFYIQNPPWFSNSDSTTFAAVFAAVLISEMSSLVPTSNSCLLGIEFGPNEQEA